MKVTIIAVTGILLVSTAWARVEDEKHFADKSRAASVHKLAIISITGPESFKVALSKIPSTDVVNEIEPKLMDTLKAGGFTIVPLAETKALATANWQTIFYDKIPYKQKQDGKAKGMTPEQQLAALKQVNAIGRVFGNGASGMADQEGNRIATPNTIIVEDFVDSRAKHADDIHIYGPAFCQTMGELARRLGADAAVIVTTEPGMLGTAGIGVGTGQGSASGKKTSNQGGFGALVRSVKEPLGGDHPEEILHVVFIDQGGEYVYGEKLFVTANEKQGIGAITLHYDAEKTLKGIREATDEAMTKLLERYPK